MCGSRWRSTRTSRWSRSPTTPAPTVDHAVATKIKEVLTLDRPFVKKTAWVGAESIPHAFMENFHNFSQREIVTFKTREEAMDWLVGE